MTKIIVFSDKILRIAKRLYHGRLGLATHARLVRGVHLDKETIGECCKCNPQPLD